MSKKITIAAFALRKCAEEFQNSSPKINRQGKDGAKLNDDRVHFPIPAVKIDIQKRFDDPQMSGRTDRQEFGEPFDDTEHDRQ